jgi:type II secretory pathway component HofQ
MRFPARFVFCIVILAVAGTVRAGDGEKPAGGKEGRTQVSSAILIEKLDRRVDLVLADIDVKTAVRQIGEIADVNIVIDMRALKDLETRGVRRNVDVRLKNVPLKQALAVMLRSVGLEFAVYDHFIYVSTPDRVRRESLEKLKTRFYSLKSSGTRSLPKVLVTDPATGAGSVASPAQRR